MSDVEQASTPEPQIAGHSWQEGVDWTAKHWPRLRMGHEGMMLESAQRGLRIRETIAKNSMTGDRKNLDGWPGHEGDDAMGVNIGDHIHYHVTQPPATSAQETPIPAPPSPSPTPADKSLASKLAPYLIGASILGGPLAGYAASKWLTTTPPAATANVPNFTDTYTDVEAVQLYQPKAKE